ATAPPATTTPTPEEESSPARAAGIGLGGVLLAGGVLGLVVAAVAALGAAGSGALFGYAHSTLGGPRGDLVPNRPLLEVVWQVSWMVALGLLPAAGLAGIVGVVLAAVGGGTVVAARQM
ncbi:MAG: hypothetical protein AB2A00_41575, partial [Myxococcota bacterium]